LGFADNIEDEVVLVTKCKKASICKLVTIPVFGVIHPQIDLTDILVACTSEVVTY
jgi:hypothetical protein